MGNSNNRLITFNEYNTIDITSKYHPNTLMNSKINNRKKSINQYNNDIVKYKKINDLDIDRIELDQTTINDQYELLNKKGELPWQQYYPNLYDNICNYQLHNNSINPLHVMKNKKYKKNVYLLKIKKFYFYCTRHLFKSNYMILDTNDPIETSISTAPINIRSALPNLNSGSRGYYNQTNSSQSIQSSNYPDRNVNTMKSGRSTNELPQIVDSMNEVQQLRSQLNMLSKLIESDGSNPVRTASALRQTAAKSTQTEFGYLLDRQAKKSNAEISELRGIIKIKEEAIHLLEEENSRLSDSLKTFLYNMNKPGNLDKTTMSTTNHYPIKSYDEYQDLFDNNNKQRHSNNPVNMSHHPHHHQRHQQQQQQQQQQKQQQQAHYQHDYTPQHHHHHHSPQPRQRDHQHSDYNPSKHTLNQTYTHLNCSNTSTPINTPMIISPSHLSMIKPDIYDRTISPQSISPYKLDNSKRQLISPSSLPSSSLSSSSPPLNQQINLEKIKNIKRQLSPTGKRFPYYQPYIHSLMHSNELNKVDKHKCSNESKTLSRGLTTTQAQLIKSPTQRLLMQSLPSTDY